MEQCNFTIIETNPIWDHLRSQKKEDNYINIISEIIYYRHITPHFPRKGKIFREFLT